MFLRFNYPFKNTPPPAALELDFLGTSFLRRVVPIYCINLLMSPLALGILVKRYNYSLALVMINLPVRLAYSYLVIVSRWGKANPRGVVAVNAVYMITNAVLEGVASRRIRCAELEARGTLENGQDMLGNVVGFVTWFLMNYPTFKAFAPTAVLWGAFLLMPFAGREGPCNPMVRRLYKI